MFWYHQIKIRQNSSTKLCWFFLKVIYIIRISRHSAMYKKLCVETCEFSWPKISLYSQTKLLWTKSEWKWILWIKTFVNFAKFWSLIFGLKSLNNPNFYTTNNKQFWCKISTIKISNQRLYCWFCRKDKFWWKLKKSKNEIYFKENKTCTD